MTTPSQHIFDRRWVFLNAFHNFWTQFGRMALGFAQGVLLIHLVGAEGKGVVALMTAAILVPVALFSFGLGGSAQYHLATRRGDPRTITSLIIVYAVFVGGLIAWAVRHFNTPFIALFLTEVKTPGEFVPLASPMALALMLNISFSQLLVSADRVQTRNLIQIVEEILGIAGIVLLIGGLHMGIHGAVLATTLAASGGAILNGWVALQRYPFTWTWDGATVRSLFKYGLCQHASGVLIFVFKRAEYFLLAYFIDVAAIGIYAVATTFVGLLLTFGRSVQEVAMTALASADRENRSGEIAGRLSRCLLFVSLLLILPAGLVGAWLIPQIYGAEFVVAILPYWVLLVTVLFWGPGPYLTMYVTSIGRPGLGAISTLAVTVLNVMVSFVLIPRLGLVGNAIGTVAGYGLNVVFGLYFYQRFSGNPWYSAVVITRDDWQYLWRMATQFLAAKKLFCYDARCK